MDILTHTFSGLLTGTVFAPFVKTPKAKIGVIATGALAAALPDIDAISLWSRFGSIGKIFNLPPGPAIYGGKYWYSHHAFFHSIAASLLFAIIFIAMLWLFSSKGRSKTSLPQFFKNNIIVFCTFVAAWFAHLLGDMPTPASVWGGVQMFWPSSTYIGGSGKIWWWNNYDIFLLIAVSIIINTSVLIAGKKTKQITAGVTAICILLILIQINTRKYNYAYTGNTKNYDAMEQESKKEQKRILGNTLYNAMEKFDKKMKFHF